MVSFLLEVKCLCMDLNYLLICEDVFWLDVMVSGDGCVFVFCDLVFVSGVVFEVKCWLIVILVVFI